MLEIMELPYMQRAFAGGAAVGLLASYYGVFVVQRGLSFLGSGLAHSAFGGVALGLLLGLEPLAVAIPFTLAVALAIVWVQQKTRLGGDTAIGIFFSVSMALGVIFLELRRGYSADPFTYLFGSILAVTWTDLAVAGLALAATAAAFPLWPRWAYATFDRELAEADGVRVRAQDYALSAALAVTTVIAVKLVGIVLVASFLVIPAATARLLARTFIGMTLASMACGTASALAGLAASYWLDLPSGPVIVLLQAAIFLAALAAGRAR